MKYTSIVSPSAKLLHVKTFESYEGEKALQNISQEDTISSAVVIEPTIQINPEEFFYHLNDVYGISLDDLPQGFGFFQDGNRISLTFGSVPHETILLTLFSVFQSKLADLKLQGINQVIFNAGVSDEIVFSNVTSINQPNATLIPTILSRVQAIHSEIKRT